MCLEATIPLWTTLLPLGSLQRSIVIIKSISFVVSLILEKTIDIVPKTNLWNRLEELKVSFKLRVVAVRLHEKVIAKFKNT
jgi:hypothetical protein